MSVLQETASSNTRGQAIGLFWTGMFQWALHQCLSNTLQDLRFILFGGTYGDKR